MKNFGTGSFFDILVLPVQKSRILAQDRFFNQNSFRGFLISSVANLHGKKYPLVQPYDYMLQ